MIPIIGKLSMARRAGKLICGFDSVKEAVGNGSAVLVMTASDLSPKTLKEVNFFCKGKTDVLPLPVTADELGAGSGFRAGVTALTDEGFAGAARSALNVR